MDQDALLRNGQTLVRLLDDTPVRPRFAMWVNFSDADSWRLWIVPAKTMTDRRTFCFTVADMLSKHSAEFTDMDADAVEFTPETRPGVQAMKKFMSLPGVGDAGLSGDRFDSIFLPDAIVIRSAL